MITEISRSTLKEIRNPDFAAYARQYLDIYDRFLDQVRGLGLDFEPVDSRAETAQKMASLVEKGARLHNGGRALFVSRMSPACVACQTGVGSATFFISLKCHRQCFYCFNPNQEEYDAFRARQRDVSAELEELHRSGQEARYLALTGGEPLLHREEALDFFRTARRCFPEAGTRLYTSGDFVDEALLTELRDAGLEEIRFSLRLQDSEPVRLAGLERIALATRYLPRVMVEMPVLPGRLDEMKDILLRLDEAGAFGINLLELCFPFNNAESFRSRSLRLKNPPYRVLYNYWYAGGLPVAGSERDALELLDFALERRLRLGVLYCSLENKHTGQLYQQNAGASVPETHRLSPRDYFLKSAKVFGNDGERVKIAFRRQGFKGFVENPRLGFVEFPPDRVRDLATGLPNLEVAISSGVMEAREDGKYLREVKVDLIHPGTFDPDTEL
ncbi:MAG: radical SAM protein [Bacillota bacterium]